MLGEVFGKELTLVDSSFSDCWLHILKFLVYKHESSQILFCKSNQTTNFLFGKRKSHFPPCRWKLFPQIERFRFHWKNFHNNITQTPEKFVHTQIVGIVVWPGLAAGEGELRENLFWGWQKHKLKTCWTYCCVNSERPQCRRENTPCHGIVLAVWFINCALWRLLLC